jgi:hypothetical protein
VRLTTFPHQNKWRAKSGVRFLRITATDHASMDRRIASPRPIDVSTDMTPLVISLPVLAESTAQCELGCRRRQGRVLGRLLSPQKLDTRGMKGNRCGGSSIRHGGDGCRCAPQRLQLARTRKPCWENALDVLPTGA